MSKVYSWAEIRESAASAFGGSYPDATLEQELMDDFRERPAYVIAAVEDVVKGYKAGRIHSPWPFLRKRLQAGSVDVQVDDSSERERHVRCAEMWTRNAGCYVETEAEILDALFDLGGPLQQWKDDEELRARCVELWREVRPLGVASEREAEERIRRQAASLERAREKLADSEKPAFAGFVAPDEWGAD